MKDGYTEKLDYIGPEVDDPYDETPILTSPYLESLLGAEYPDLNNYVINTPSPVPKQELKGCYKKHGRLQICISWMGW